MNGDEADNQDETWCLYDGELVDDDLNLALCAFKSGVRVLVLSDSCHSGTATRAIERKANGTTFDAEAIRLCSRLAVRLLPLDNLRRKSGDQSRISITTNFLGVPAREGEVFVKFRQENCPKFPS